MDIFEDSLNKYFKLPYRPEYLYKNIREILKNYNFNLVKESKLAINENTYKLLFKSIFPNETDSYKFNNKAIQSKSIENFKNLVYENSKVDIKSIQKREITAYLFILDEFKHEIIRIIYFAASRNEQNIFDKIFCVIYYEQRNINRYFFDYIFFSNWMNFNIINEKIDLTKNINENNVFSKENMMINYIKFKYYGPDQTKYYFEINKIGENNEVTLFSPDFLIKNNMKLQYNYDDFQIFNENNDCPNLFSFILDKAIIEMNKGINGEKMDDDIVSNIGIIEFKDKSVGVYLNMVNMTEYYESENLKKNLIPKIKNNVLHLVCSSVNTESRAFTEDSETEEKYKKEKYTDQQKLYMEYTAHVHEEQISTMIINLIGNEILGNGMKRLPRIIFYFNFYILKSKEEKERIAFFLNDKVYGFEEADGVFYLDNSKEDVILNERDNIPFINIMKFDLINPTNISHEDNKKIIFKNNTLIFIEVKNTFPLKYEKKNNERKILGIKDTKVLITNIVKKAIKFKEIALSLKKTIDKIHILLFYDSLLQPSDDIKTFEEEFKKILKNVKIKENISTSFDVVYFVNPASINMRKLSNIVIELKEENKKIPVLENENKQLKLKMEELEQNVKLLMSKNNDITIIQDISENFYYAKINPKEIKLTNIIEKINNELANRKEIIIDILNLFI